MTDEHSGIGAGVRAGLPFLLPTLALGISFGVLAEPVMGSLAPIVMSVCVFAGGAQFAALSVLQAGGAAGAAISAGLLMNARFLPMGFAIAPSLRGRPLARAAQGQALVAAATGAAITIALMPFAPAGLPVIAASLAAFVGLRRA